MRETWRWVGPPDEIRIAEISQSGARGIVSVQHHIPTGAAWPDAAIDCRKQEIEGPADAPTGLTWDLVESLPVSEAMKTQTGPWRTHLKA